MWEFERIPNFTLVSPKLFACLVRTNQYLCAHMFDMKSLVFRKELATSACATPRPASVLKKGFTLIELLVVIAIIAILASILFPVFARARENARRASCQSNLKQLGLSIMQYTQDYDEYYPKAYIVDSVNTPPGGRWAGNNWYWPQIVFPYHKSVQIFACPSQSAFVQTPYLGHYGINRAIAPVPSVNPTHAGQITSPATAYLVLDAGNYSLDGAEAKTASATSTYLPGAGSFGVNCGGMATTNTNLQKDCGTGRHLGGINIAFADGHVKWAKTDVALQEARKFTGTTTAHAISAWNPARSS